MNSALLQLTQQIAACRRCRDDRTTFVGGRSVLAGEGEGDGSASKWAPPRGWAGATGSSVDIVLVALNPGGPLPGELDHYRSCGITESLRSVSRDQAEALGAHCLDQYRAPRRGQNWIFHRKSVALARSLLWLLDGRDPGTRPWERCWFTDVFKCSTRSESSPQIKDAAFDACLPFLKAELAAAKPRLIVALGRQVRIRLRQAGVHPFVPFRHPANGCPRLDAAYHDPSFEKAARQLGVGLPPEFRTARQRAYEEAMAM
jgi:hypothetical protein